MAIKIYNTLTRKKEEFVPIEEGHVRMYNCGPTVYDYFHIGNARTFLIADIIRRYLEYRGYSVKFVQNLTDIEDKIINKASELGIDSSEVAEKYTKAYFEDADALGIRKADLYPKATEHISDMIEFVSVLEEKDIAYEVDGDVYYNVIKFPDYGKLSNRKIEDMRSGARVEVDERKKHPADFALWKKSKPEEPAYSSPWGKGRPGWHIECSVMSMKHLGETIDIHTGGSDLIFPHHENEIAQSEAVTGKPLAKYWLHFGLLQVEGNRMGKSNLNFLTVRDALKEYSPETIRHFLLSAHYRSPLDYRETSLQESSQAITRLKNCLSNLDHLADDSAFFEPEDIDNSETKLLYESVGKVREDFENVMDDDFNTAGAIGAVFELVGNTNRFIAANEDGLSAEDKAVLAYVRDNIIKLCDVLGIYSKEEQLSSDQALVDELMKLIIEIRQNARSEKDWDTADKIRDRLEELGIQLKDTREGTVWTKEE